MASRIAEASLIPSAAMNSRPWWKLSWPAVVAGLVMLAVKVRKRRREKLELQWTGRGDLRDGRGELRQSDEEHASGTTASIRRSYDESVSADDSMMAAAMSTCAVDRETNETQRLQCTQRRRQLSQERQ